MVISCKELAKLVLTIGSCHYIIAIVIQDMPGWRNGRRYGLKIRWAQVREGSSPSPGTTRLLQNLSGMIGFF